VGYEQDKKLCLEVPGLDLIIGGHSHTDLVDGRYPTKVVRPDGSECWVVQAYAYGRYMGILDVNFDADGKLFFSGQAYLALDNRVIPDVRSQNLLASFTSRLSTSLKEVVGVASSPIDGSRDCRKRECEMGNLVTDAMLAYGKFKEGAEIAIQNGGGLRSSIDAGEITREDVLSVLPFGNIHTTLSIPGSTIISVLENALLAAGNGEISGRFPQVAGIRLEASFSATPGQRVKKVMFGNEPIVASKYYRVITNGFLASGGDGFEWTDAKDIQRSGRSLVDLLSEYLTANNPYTPKVEDVPFSRANNSASLFIAIKSSSTPLERD